MFGLVTLKVLEKCFEKNAVWTLTIKCTYKVNPYSLTMIYAMILAPASFFLLHFRPRRVSFNPALYAITHTLHNHPHTHTQCLKVVCFMLAGAIAGTAEPSRQEEREGSEEERPDRLSTAQAGSMVSQSHYIMFVLCCRFLTQLVLLWPPYMLSGGKMASWDYFTLTQEMAQYFYRPKQSTLFCNMFNDTTQTFVAFLTCHMCFRAAHLDMICMFTFLLHIWCFIILSNTETFTSLTK